MAENSDSLRSSSGRRSEDSATVLVWATLGDLYGQLWRTNYGDVPSPAWRAALAGLTPQEIRTGLRAAVESGRAQPPTAPTFRAYCRPPDRRTSEQRALYGRIDAGSQTAALPSPEHLAGRTRVGRQWLAYWWLREIRPRPRDVTMEQMDEMLDGADVAEMDRRVRRHREAIEAGNSVHNLGPVATRLRAAVMVP